LSDKIHILRNKKIKKEKRIRKKGLYEGERNVLFDLEGFARVKSGPENGE
jgi:hypothetical protein